MLGGRTAITLRREERVPCAPRGSELQVLALHAGSGGGSRAGSNAATSGAAAKSLHTVTPLPDDRAADHCGHLPSRIGPRWLVPGFARVAGCPVGRRLA